MRIEYVLKKFAYVPDCGTHRPDSILKYTPKWIGIKSQTMIIIKIAWQAIQAVLNERIHA